MRNLENIAVGDYVMVTTFGWGTYVPLRKSVKRVLKRQIELEDGTKWTKNGRRVGAGTWSREYAAPWGETIYQERVAAHNAACLKNCVCNFFGGKDCGRLTLEQWEQVRAICGIKP